MIKEIRNIKSGERELRKFGIMVGVILLILAGYSFWKEKESAQLFLGIATFFIVAGFALPVVLKPLYMIWMSFAVVLGWFMTRIILGMLFYTIITSIGVVSRLFGKRFLEQGFDESKGSYWIHRINKKVKKQDYERQF